MGSFKAFVEIGRVCVISHGKDFGKLVVIADVVDQNRALCDAPGMVRQVINFKQLAVTPMKIEIPRIAKKKVMSAAWKEADVDGKFAASAWGKKLAARSAKAAMTDLDRYKAKAAKAKAGGKAKAKK